MESIKYVTDLHYRDTKTISIKIILVSLLSTLIQAGKLCSFKKISPADQDK